LPAFQEEPEIVTVSCEENDVMVGGGFAGSAILDILSSMPVGEDSWQVSAVNGTGEDQELRVYVRCASLSPHQQGK